MGVNSIPTTIADNEQPILLSPAKVGIRITGYTSSQVEILSEVSAPTPFMIVIVPTIYVRAATIPWKDIWRKLKNDTTNTWNNIKISLSSFF